MLIERREYLDIISKMPIVCVDLIIVYQDKYLLVKRREEPARNRWWFPGGRLFKGETLRTAAMRKAREEVGLDVVPSYIVDVVETEFENGPDNIPVHSVNICFLCKAREDNIVLDLNHDGYRWVNVSTFPKDLDNRLKDCLQMVFGDN